MKIQYLEIVTPDVDAVCATYEKVHGVVFSPPEPSLGNARTAPLSNGGRIGVRAPLRESEAPIVRPYILTQDVTEATERAEQSGAEIAHPPFQLPGQGEFSIYIQGDVEHALWH